MNVKLQNEKLSMFGAIKYLAKYIKPYRSMFVRFYVGWLTDRILVLVMPIMFGIMIDEIVYYKNTDTFMRISLVYVFVMLFSCILYFLIYALHHYLMNMYTFGIKLDVFNHMQKADAIYMSGKNTGDIISIIQHYTGECMHFIIRNIIHNINNIFTLVFYIIYSFIINWQFGLLIVLTAPIAVYVSAKYGKKIRVYSDKEKEYYGDYMGWLYEMLSGLRDIRLLGGKTKADRAFISNHRKLFSLNIKTGVLDLHAKNIIDGTNLLLQLSLFTMAAFLTLRDKITIGSLTVILTYFAGIKNCIDYLSSNYLNGQMRVSYIQRIHDFLESPTEDQWPGTSELKVTHGNIRFNNVTFSYDNEINIINEFSLNISSGQHFALVGKSGCGKTTLAYMMIGFYSPQCGDIEIDGQNISDCSLKSIRNNIGLIQQDTLIFDGSIKDNLLLGNRKATDDDIKEACMSAGIWSFIQLLPNGIDTIVGSNGVGLSGGQKQRISIARIYLKNPKIIIFDEATSALDDNTEKRIHESWKQVLKGRTAIVIAHRQSSVMLCDKIAVLEKGKLVEVGVPSDMVRKSNVFKTLFTLNREEELNV